MKHFWGRGDGWVAVGMTEMLTELPAQQQVVHAGGCHSAEHHRRSALLATYTPSSNSM